MCAVLATSSGLPQAPREVGLALARLPARVVVGTPFTATFKVQSHVDRCMGPLQLAAAAAEQASPGGSPARTPSGRQRSGDGAAGSAPALVGASSSSSSTAGGAAGSMGAAAAAVCLDGAESVIMAELAPRQAAEVQLRLLALAVGQQALPALALSNERDGRLYALLPPVDLFVDSV
jgi:hypothetical protein